MLIVSFADGLTHKNVVSATNYARARWFDLGIELDIDVDTLEVKVYLVLQLCTHSLLPKRGLSYDTVSPEHLN